MTVRRPPGAMLIEIAKEECLVTEERVVTRESVTTPTILEILVIAFIAVLRREP